MPAKRPAKRTKRAKPTKAKKQTKAKKPAKKVAARPPARPMLKEFRPGMFTLFTPGPGYAWERIAEKLIRDRKLGKKFNFDCEAGSFSVSSADQDCLIALQELLEPYRVDPDKFRALEKAARAEGND